LERLQQLETEVARGRQGTGVTRLQHSSNASEGPLKCFRCQEEGHLAFGCRHGMPVSCFKCNKTGHISKACRSGLNA